MVADTATPACPHCGKQMLKWQVPDGSTWNAPFLYICFNDDCPYFVHGWERMRDQYNVTGSYRHRRDPSTGEEGPLPVWSRNALRDSIIEDD